MPKRKYVPLPAEVLPNESVVDVPPEVATRTLQAKGSPSHDVPSDFSDLNISNDLEFESLSDSFLNYLL